jgi:hypothetical protein
MYQEYLGVDFHNKHCFINLLVDKIWDANKQSGMIHFNLVTEYNNPNIYWKKKKKVVNVLDMWSNSLWGGGEVGCLLNANATHKNANVHSYSGLNCNPPSECLNSSPYNPRRL